MITAGIDKPKLNLRPYQSEALDGIRSELEANRSTLLVMATGLGKTFVFSQLAAEYMDHSRVMVLAHREELIGQAWRELKRLTGSEPDVEMGEYRAAEGYTSVRSQIVVGTVQSQIAGKTGLERMQKFNPNEFSLLVVDEAHHSPARSYRKIIDYYTRNPELKVLGVTATPDRADEAALGKIFDSVAYEFDIEAGVGNGWLVPISQQSVHVEGLDYSSIRTTAGDLNGADLARVLEFEQTLHGFVSPTLELAGDRKTLIFTASLAQAERLTEILNRHKSESARWVSGRTPKELRRSLFEDYATGDFQFLVNVNVGTEGFDCPAIELVVMARPTKSRALYAQMVGRGTRTLPGVIDGIEAAEARKFAIKTSRKPFLEVVDFVGNAGRHRLITSADILGGNYDDKIIERAKRNAENKSGDKPVDILDELALAESQIEREKREAAERARRQQLKLRARYSTAKINPFDIYNMQPWRERAWHKDRQPTEKQVAFLERNGVDVAGLSFTHASQLIKKIIDNRENGKCTFKQAKVLSRYGYDPAEISFANAGKLITAIANNGWKKPA